jgi:cytoskeleton protein RodZ
MTDSPQQMPSEQSGPSPGSVLRAAREAAGLTQMAVGEALHLTGHYIRSLENDEYHKLPGLIFVKGYIRSYGHFLKLDVDALMALYERQVQSMPEVKNQTLAGNYTRKRNDQAIGWAIAATLVIVLSLGIGWWFVGRDSKSDSQSQVQVRALQPTAATERRGSDEAEQTASQSDTTTGGSDTTTQPAADGAGTTAAPVATPGTNSDKISITPAPAGGRQINLLGPGPDQLQMNFGSSSWVEVDDSFGKRLYAEMLHAGDVLQLQGRAPFLVLLGDARNVKVNFNATAIDISRSIRSDTTARLTLANPGNSASPLADNSGGARTVGVSH